MVYDIAVFQVASTNTRNPILYICEYSTGTYVHMIYFEKSNCISLISVINDERFQASVTCQGSKYASELYTKDKDASTYFIREC